MIEKLSDGFYLITRSSLLKKAIAFLQKNFSWNDEKSIKIFDRLIDQELKLPYGAVLINNEKIVSAILLFHQGRCVIENKEIINVSSWFAEKSYRGIEAITFAKKLIKSIDDSIITNYTPSPVACKIFKSLNFTDMYVDKYEIGATNQFPFFKIFSIWKIVSLKGNNILSLKKNANLNNEYKENTCFYSKNTTRRYKLNLSILNIYLVTHNAKVDLINLVKLIIKYRAVKVNFFYKSDIKVKSNVWLIKNQKIKNFILPWKSELEI